MKKMSMWLRCKKVFYDAVQSNSSPHKLALSFALGLFVAFSPFPGGHTLIMLSLHWLLRLNLPVLFLVTSFNNPWTAIPFYTFDYYFGYWFVHSFLGWSPSWIISFEKIFGSGKICIWSFLVGGNVLGIFSALVSYPVMMWFFGRYRETEQRQEVL